MPLPTNRTTSSTDPEHVSDHNILHGLYNDWESGAFGAWTQVGVNAELPTETYTALIDTDTTSQLVSPDDYIQAPVTYIAASAGATISSVYALAWAPRSIDLVRLHLTRITDANGTFLVMPGAYSLQTFTSSVLFDTVVLGPFPAAAILGTHFTFPDVDNANYNSTSSLITIKNAGHYRLGVDVHWLAP